MFKIALIDDDSTLRASVEKYIHFTPNMQCIISAPTLDDFWETVPKRAVINLFFLDIELPDGSGLDHIPLIKKTFPEADIVMLTRYDQPDHLMRAMNTGASGYLLKDFDYHNIVEYINIHQEGGALISPKMARFLVQYFNPPKPTIELGYLSARELQILRLFSEGNSYDETALIMGLNLNTLRYHIKNIYKKLNVHNKQEALIVAKNTFNIP
jgi:DNA-binding NarL/FixJ family response regulator